MDFPLPELGEGVYEAEMIRWLIQTGDVVRRGQSLLEVMTDKATMEVPSPFAGRIRQLMVEAGTKIKVGQTILSYSEGSVESGPASSPSAAQSHVAAAVPALASSGVGSNHPETAFPLTTSGNGNSHEQPIPPANRSGALPPSSATVVAAPSVRHLARTLGIDLTRVSGSGPAGRILLDDLTPFLKSTEKPAIVPTPEPNRYDVGKAGTQIKLQGLRRKIAEHMLAAKQHIPQYSYIDEYDITEMVQLRQSLREPCNKRGLKLTYLAFFIKAVAVALKEVPLVNSSMDEKTEIIHLHNQYNIGMAVAAPNGLIVPVIKDADKKDLFAIANEIERLGNDAKSGRIKLEDLRGGTFTITSIGNIGGLISTPIINHPEVGIMGIGKVVKRPVYDDQGRIQSADIVYLSFSFDHRVVDGAIGALFGNAVMKALQNPTALLLPDRLK